MDDEPEVLGDGDVIIWWLGWAISKLTIAPDGAPCIMHMESRRLARFGLIVSGMVEAVWATAVASRRDSGDSAVQHLYTGADRKYG